MEEEVQCCKNCKRDISAKNYVIHSVHCERKIQLCDRCLEPVPRSELEKHEEEFHSKDTCSECGISVEKWQVEKHKETCAKKLVSCEYCELEVPLDNLSEHSAVCGSRTKQCRKCNKHVMIKDLEIHHTNCSRRDICARVLVPCEYCELEIPLGILLEHSAACGSRTEQCSRCNKYVVIKDLENHHTNCLRRELEAVPCEYCDLQIDWNEMMEHTAMCGTRTERCFLCNGRVMVKDRDTHFITCGKTLNFNESITCDCCGGSFNNRSIQRHIEFCRSRSEKCNECNHYIQRQDMGLHLTMCEQKKQLRLEIPCQYCGELFPSDFVEDHADICGTRLQKCEKCDKYISLKNIETHSNVCKENISKTHGNCPVCHQSVPWVEMNVHSAYCAQIYYETSEYEHQNKFNELALKKEAEEFAVKNTEEKRPQRHLEEDVEICPSCKYGIPEQKYHEHLLLCFNGKTQCHFCGIEVPRNYEHVHFRDCHKI
ncbi:TRAF-type zinc finger domain-containing protein 1 [Araneus ventricosus]|uniref:TRAF-type zinc finger domain-containing protein 1 n=1 Tax=Araneus ventricosus TaxID=182803 RepID=A0A4Y2M5S7_ARAVE|nr:TRAF-type zinc finger domain-containing protein 1 [Araneus ventricosus]